MKLHWLNIVLWFSFSLCAICIPGAAVAVTASPYPFDFTQPDGSRVTIRMMGDERVKWAETLDHYSLLRNKDGSWEYGKTDASGDLIPSGYLAHNKDERSEVELVFLASIQTALFYSRQQIGILQSMWEQDQSRNANTFVPLGNKSLVMILIGFTDLAFTKTQTDFNNLMNQVGYNANGATGSVKDFYLENSYNQFNVTTTVAGPYTASNTMAYYGANTGGSGTDIRPRELVTEAVNLANPDVNYADFDNDNDGTVDGVYIIYAGYGEEAGASANAIWAHAWNITPVVLDGKTTHALPS